MKKILLFSVLAAGFVTIASAAVNCNSPHAYDQCCADRSAIYQAAAGGVIPAMNGDHVTWLNPQLTTDGSVHTCATTANFLAPDQTRHSGTCNWPRGDWQNSIQCS